MFATRIRTLRLGAKLKQPAVAAACGVTRESVSQWESASMRPAFDKVVSIARFFNVTVDYLFGVSDDDGPPLKISKEARRCVEAWDSLPASGRNAILSIIEMTKTDGGKNASNC